MVIGAGEESMCAPFVKLTKECVKMYNDQFFLPMSPQGEVAGGKKKRVCCFFSPLRSIPYNKFTLYSFPNFALPQSDDISLIKHSRTGNLKDIQKLLPGASTKAKAHALSIAASGNHLPFVETLLTNGVDPTNMGEGGEEGGEGKKNQKEMAKMLTVEPGMHAAARAGHMDIVKLILKWSKSAMFYRNSVGETPLDVAIKNKYGKIAVELCRREHFRNRVAHQGMYVSGLNTCIRGKQEGVLMRMLRMPKKDPSLLPPERVSRGMAREFFLIFSYSHSFYNRESLGCGHTLLVRVCVVLLVFFWQH